MNIVEMYEMLVNISTKDEDDIVEYSISSIPELSLYLKQNNRIIKPLIIKQQLLDDIIDNYLIPNITIIDTIIIKFNDIEINKDFYYALDFYEFLKSMLNEQHKICSKLLNNLSK